MNDNAPRLLNWTQYYTISQFCWTCCTLFCFCFRYWASNFNVCNFYNVLPFWNVIRSFSYHHIIDFVFFLRHNLICWNPKDRGVWGSSNVLNLLKYLLINADKARSVFGSHKMEICGIYLPRPWPGIQIFQCNGFTLNTDFLLTNKEIIDSTAHSIEITLTCFHCIWNNCSWSIVLSKSQPPSTSESHFPNKKLQINMLYEHC